MQIEVTFKSGAKVVFDAAAFTAAATPLGVSVSWEVDEYGPRNLLWLDRSEVAAAVEVADPPMLPAHVEQLTGVVAEVLRELREAPAMADDADAAFAVLSAVFGAGWRLRPPSEAEPD